MILEWNLFSMSLSASDVVLVPLDASSCSSVLSSSAGLHDALRSGVVGKVETPTVSESKTDSVEGIAGKTDGKRWTQINQYETEIKEEKSDVSGETVSVQSQLGKQEISLHILDTAH
jgi:hypothetical protein